MGPALPRIRYSVLYKNAKGDIPMYLDFSVSPGVVPESLCDIEFALSVLFSVVLVGNSSTGPQY
jgi:hypothetical protein